ncbi:MAG: FMN-binding protein [Myxococcales bacterium]|jgi:electron transport complex protein RnfG
MTAGGAHTVEPTGASPVRLVVTLVVAGLISGTALAAVHVASAPRIAENRAQALARAVLAVVPGAKRFEPHPMPEGAPGVYAAFDASGRRLGFAVEGQGPGFMDSIALLYGIDPRARRVIGLQILESRETPGLGDKIMTDPTFVHSFDRLAVDPEIVAVTRRPATAENEVDCISGATISSKAVVRIVADSVQRWLPRMQESP